MPKKRLTALNGLTAQLRNIGAVMADPFRLKETVMLFLTLDGSGRLRKRYSITVSDIYLQNGTPFVADRFGNSAEASLLIAEHLNSRPDFELYMYDGYGHAAYDCAPDYTERLLKFLKK